MRIHYIGLLSAGLLMLTSQTWAQTGEGLIKNKCRLCHTTVKTKKAPPAPTWQRISQQRKTPEGWLMTIARMQLIHDLKITQEERRTLVKYLADRQGLAPQESAPFRYILETRLNTREKIDNSLFAEMCARCHSGARVGLQRRTEEEWRKLVHFHLGQFPTLEYQAMGRDRDWFPIALNKMVPYLAKTYPFTSDAWTAWQKQKAVNLAGAWRITGRLPEKGAYVGTLNATETSTDHYDLTFTGHTLADNKPLTGKGSAIVYTNYEWRGSLTLDGVKMRQVLQRNQAGDQLTGRMFSKKDENLGGDVTAIRGTNQLLTTYPRYLKVGSSTTLSLLGSDLAGKISTPDTIKVDKIISQNSQEIQLAVTVSDAAKTGTQQISVGKNKIAITVYDKIARIGVEPAYAVARVGGADAPTPKAHAHFDAVAYSAGKDGKAGTADDQRIGIMPASWAVSPFDAQAKADKDIEFAGKMNAETGLFVPAVAGPNPKRKFSTNNAGNLKVTASVKEGETTLTGDGQLIVTVQRWNNPPIR